MPDPLIRLRFRFLVELGRVKTYKGIHDTGLLPAGVPNGTPGDVFLLSGNTTGLKPSHLQLLSSLGKRRNPPDQLFGLALATLLVEAARETGREIGLLVDRKGQVKRVIAGTSETLPLPPADLPEGGRLPGLRLLHAHPSFRPLSKEDITTLYSHRLDAVAVVGKQHPEAPVQISWACLDPEPPFDPRVEKFQPLGRLELDFSEWVRERQFVLDPPRAKEVRLTEKALLVVVAPDHARLERRSRELAELARTAGVEVHSVHHQLRKKPDPRTLVGKGKLEDILQELGKQELDLLILDPALSPTQARTLSDMTPVRIVDRTMLILDIFAQRAQTHEGKLQVELAQLKYTLPRLVGKNSFMSRLMGGGTGGRGPGETKLEIDRRRVRERIERLDKRIERLAGQRAVQRKKRQSRHVPVIAIVGYTNAGKSTLLHALTGAEVLIEDKLFATLDPRTRRVRFPNEAEVIFTDTVGFIEDLPEDLARAFRATLEELEQADLLLHLVDRSDPEHLFKRRQVEKVLEDMGLGATPRITVFNKMDRLVSGEAWAIADLAISATDPATLLPLVSRILDFFKVSTLPRQTAIME